MIKKSDIVRESVKTGDYKKALRIAKDFRIGITKEQRALMSRAYECMVRPEFYEQIGVNIEEAIRKGKQTVSEYAERSGDVGSI